LTRADVHPSLIEDLVLGCAQPEGEQGLNVARIVGELAGLPDDTPAMTINRFCSSGLQAAAIIADRIAVGAIDAGIAGGLESMSMIPMGGTRPSLNPTAVEKMPDVSTGILTQPFPLEAPNSTAEVGRLKSPSSDVTSTVKLSWPNPARR
jgi:acetyl-CoA acetyltransferase